MRTLLLTVISTTIIGSVCIPAEAFHDGSVGNCSGCHTIHNSRSGNAAGPGTATSKWLMRGADPSSICLNCHAGTGSPDSHHVASPDGTAMSPGGDFYWLTKDFVWPGGASPGASHGHNVVAQDFGFAADPRLATSPGGAYPSAKMGCNSCHNPHGEAGVQVSGSGSYGGSPPGGRALGSYRLLGGKGYDGGKQATGITFKSAAPVARQSATGRFGESQSSHVDYGSGMSAWCRNCHEGVHRGNAAFKHPAGDRLDRDMVDSYNRYVRTGDLSGSPSTSYLTLAPIERGVTDVSLLDPSSPRGADTTSEVMCLTCHRAHASAFRAAGRWDFNAATLAQSHPAPGDGGVSGADVLHSYYGRDMLAEFGPGQRGFCEKCHAE